MPSKEQAYQLQSYQEDQAIIINALNGIAKKHQLTNFSAAQTKKTGKRLEQFECLKTYPMVVLSNGFNIKSDNQKVFQLIILTINSTQQRVSGKQLVNETIAEYEFAGLTELEKDYGQTYIRPESITDKIAELLSPIEIDFDFDKEFSNKYYVLSNNEALVRKNITSSFLTAIKKQKDLEIEIHGKQLLVRLKRRVSVQTAQTIVSFLNDIS